MGLIEYTVSPSQIIFTLQDLYNWGNERYNKAITLYKY